MPRSAISPGSSIRFTASAGVAPPALYEISCPQCLLSGRLHCGGGDKNQDISGKGAVCITDGPGFAYTGMSWEAKRGPRSARGRRAGRTEVRDYYGIFGPGAAGPPDPV